VANGWTKTKPIGRQSEQSLDNPSRKGEGRMDLNRKRRRGLGFPLALTISMSAGCVSMGSLVPCSDATSAGPACQVVAMWHNGVAFTPDPTHGGEKTPGLACRVYLFGETVDFPKIGDGKLIVDVFDETSKNPAAKTLPLEEWQIDKDTLKRLARHDAIGWGYTLFLPWGTYKPEISRVRLKVRYEPASGFPLYTESTVTLTSPEAEPLTVAGGSPRK
jgi:hypothetical protein